MTLLFGKTLLAGDELYLDKEFKKRNLTALLGCGDSPGLVNVFARKYSDMLDTVDSIVIKGAYSKHNKNLLKTWEPGWSLKQAYIDFVTDPYIYRDSKYVRMLPFDELEEVDFLNYGRKYLALHSHEEAYSLPYTIKGLKNCEFRYEVDQYAATLYSFGFDKTKEITIDNRNIKAIDFLFEMLKDLDEKKINKNDVSSSDEYSSILQISGSLNNVQKKYEVLLKPLYFDRNKTMERFGTLKIDVALPCIIGMKCIDTAPKGIAFAEELNTQKFINILNDYLEYKEILINEE